MSISCGFRGRCFVVKFIVSLGDSEGKILRLCGKSASMDKQIIVGKIVEILDKRYGYQEKLVNSSLKNFTLYCSHGLIDGCFFNTSC
ncbi:Uncharacterised protein [Bartonella vinsonii]|uniref:Uncharacterized protein n=1 Tax=Bartonella vinsonii TaxID=33047 RepID=A0A448V735_BARVI|nr:Uncharacterised protein [Bartonella vinsonii]